MPPKKRAKTASAPTPAAVPAAGGTAAPPAEAKRPRIARVLSADTQQVIINCFHAVQADKNRRGKTAEQVAALLGIAHSTVKSVMADHKARCEAAFVAGQDEAKVRPPPNAREERKREPKIKDAHVDFVSRCLSKQMLEEELEELPTVRSMYDFVIKEREETAKVRHCTVEDVFPFKRSTFHDKILRDRLGYVHRAGDDDREQLKQQLHIIEQRRVFLRRVTAVRANGFVLWYLDETWVNKNTTRRKSWELNVKSAPGKAAAAAGLPEVLRPKGKKKPTGKGGRAIVIGIGSLLTGVVPELLEIFKGKKSKTEDYHKEMNGALFEEWLEKAIDFIKAKYPGRKHAIVMDNASYHSRLVEGSATPKTKAVKADIIKYMEKNKIVPPQLLPGYNTPAEAQALLIECIQKGVEFPYKEPKYASGPLPTTEQYNTLTKPVLLSCIPLKEKIYVTDELCKAKGFQMLRLPPYHCEFNPIELVWAKAKAAVASKNVTYQLSEAMKIMRVEAEACGAEYWAKLEKHAMKEEETARGGDEIVLSAAELALDQPIVLTFESSSDDDESDDEDGD